MKNILKTICCFSLCVLCPVCVQAADDSDFELWKQQFYREAQTAGVSKRVLDQTVPQMKLLERVIHLDTRKPEYVSNFYDYTRARVSPERIAAGRKMAAKYPTWLKKVEAEYGVPRAYLLALWGMETNYGTYMGNVNMLDSLATLAYHPRRRKFFTGELIAYLKMLEQERSVVPQTGSWDGGFGNFQFMPTTFLAYAVDGDGNGRRDIVNNMPDSFASAANYLHQMGWRTTEPWGREVIIPADFDWKHIHKHEKKTVADWERIGIRPKHIGFFPDSEKNIVAEWHMPMGKNGPVFLTYPNFKIIMRWNKLSLYAISVGLLADVIENRYQPIETPPEFKPFKTTEIICMQEKLADKKYDIRDADGKIGPKTRSALAIYQRDNGLVPDAYPDDDLLKKMGCYDETR